MDALLKEDIAQIHLLDVFTFISVLKNKNEIASMIRVAGFVKPGMSRNRSN